MAMIFLDDVRIRRGKKIVCHMWTDGQIAELHEFARLIRVGNRHYFPVMKAYEIWWAKRQAAIQAGATLEGPRSFERYHAQLRGDADRVAEIDAQDQDRRDRERARYSQ